MHISLQNKITGLVIGIVFIAVLTMMLFFGNWSTENIRDKVEINILNTAHLIAEADVVRSALENEDPEGAIQQYVNSALGVTEGIEFIVVADMDSKRYSHPNPENVHKYVQGGDQSRVIATGESYVSEAIGTLGKSLRAFVPIYSIHTGQQIGFVTVGTLTREIDRAVRAAVQKIILLGIATMLIGSASAYVLAHNIKKTLLGLEPSIIVQLYRDKVAMLEAIDEGIIAIDSAQKITMINDSALTILGFSNEAPAESFVGKYVEDVFPTSRLPHILNSGLAEYDREQMIKGTIILTNRVPIMEGNSVVGAIATFRDKTRVIHLAEELTGVQQVVDALRANTHEFMNKLHVILGLIQMKAYDEAKAYIINVRERDGQTVGPIMDIFEDSTLAGLILGKLNRARELGIAMSIAKGSCLESRHENITTQALIGIIGNLVENAFDAVIKRANISKSVNLSVVERSDGIVIAVSDNGIGLTEDEKPNIFERGYTTKKDSKGVGLSIVKNAVEAYGGTIEIRNNQGDGVTVTVHLPKGGS